MEQQLHDDVLRLMERMETLMTGVRIAGGIASFVVSVLLTYLVWHHQQVNALAGQLADHDYKLANLNAHGSMFTQNRAAKHHSADGCHQPKKPL